MILMHICICSFRANRSTFPAARLLRLYPICSTLERDLHPCVSTALTSFMNWDGFPIASMIESGVAVGRGGFKTAIIRLVVSRGVLGIRACEGESAVGG